MKGGKRGGGGKKRGESAKECERWSRKQKVVLEVATCPPPFPRLCLELQAVTLQEDSNATSAPLPFRVLARVGSLLLQGLKWP